MKYRTSQLAVTAMAVIGFANLAVTRAQTPAPAKAPLAFEVTSVKLNKSLAGGGQIRPLAGGQTYVATNMAVKNIFRLMYHVMDAQIVGGPDWLATDRYDIQGKAERASNIDELHEMFQTLLADRFKLQFHRATKEMAMFALTVDKSGSKMKVNDSPQNFEIPIKPIARGKVTGLRVPMDYLCLFLSQQLDRPVVDQTNLKGNYDFNLEWTPEPPAGRGADAAPPEDPDGVTLMAALRAQLGLRIQSQKGPVPVFIIDHAERPAEN